MKTVIMVKSMQEEIVVFGISYFERPLNGICAFQ